MNFSEYIKDKSVCFVGPSPIIKGKGLGKLIDSYDVVCRTNHAFTLTTDKNYIKDYGKKTDVMYFNIQYLREMTLPIGQLKKLGVEYIRSKGEVNDNIKKYFICNSIIESLKEVYTKNMSATMGLFIINDLLISGCTDLYVTGIDLFTTQSKTFKAGQYNEYIDGYLPDWIKKQGDQVNMHKKDMGLDGHNFIDNAKGFKSLFNDTRVKTDDFIYDLCDKIISGELQQA